MSWKALSLYPNKLSSAPLQNSVSSASHIREQYSGVAHVQTLSRRFRIKCTSPSVWVANPSTLKLVNYQYYVIPNEGKDTPEV